MPGRGTDGKIIQLGDTANLLARAADRAIGFIDDWFGPWTPPPESTGKGSEEGRAFDFPTGWNLRRPPRSEDGIASVTELRELSKAAELVRLAIETRKDITAKAQWTIQPRPLYGESEFEARARAKGDNRIEDLYNFMRFPDGEHDFATWIRLILEDALVLDAATVYCRRNKAGGVRSLEVVDGATITRYLDASGRTPAKPLPAYGQWIKGMPYKNYTVDDLVYMPRNPLPFKVYGLSPVEQIILHCNIVLNRNITQLATYQYSNVPRMFLKSPPDWKPADLKDFKTWFDAALTGDLIERSKVIPIPNGTDPYEPKKDVLKDESDEWFARIICYCFGLPPNFFMKQQSRASSESYMIQADEEGALPWLQYLKSYIDRIFSNWMGCPDLEFVWEWNRKPQPLQQSQIHKIYLDSKVMTPDEVREEIGYDPLTAKQKEELNPTPPPMGPVTADGKPLGAPINVKPGMPGKPKDDSDTAMVNKINDNHDDRGRFASSGDGGADHPLPDGEHFQQLKEKYGDAVQSTWNVLKEAETPGELGAVKRAYNKAMDNNQEPLPPGPFHTLYEKRREDISANNVKAPPTGDKARVERITRYLSHKWIGPRKIDGDDDLGKSHDTRDEKTGQYEALDLIGEHYDDLMNLAETHAVEGKGVNSAAALAAVEEKRGRPLSAKARAAARDAYARHYYRTRGIDVSKVDRPKKFGY
jgi:hypothetical protein